jgi:hypothetical protein
LTPRISIVTPSFNQAPYLEATLRSVLEQGYPDLEYIVMDGGSTDGSVDILRSHASRLSYWTSAHDAGQADAINRGLARSTGEILAYLNSDDVYLPGALARVAAHFAAHPEADLVYGDYVYLDEQGRVLQHFQAPPFEAAALVLGNTVSQPTVFVRRRAWERVGPFDAALHCVMDLDYWLRAAVAGLRFERVPAEQAGMRMHAAAKRRRARPRSGARYWPCSTGSMPAGRFPGRFELSSHARTGARTGTRPWRSPTSPTPRRPRAWRGGRQRDGTRWQRPRTSTSCCSVCWGIGRARCSARQRWAPGFAGWASIGRIWAQWRP